MSRSKNDAVTTANIPIDNAQWPEWAGGQTGVSVSDEGMFVTMVDGTSRYAFAGQVIIRDPAGRVIDVCNAAHLDALYPET